MNRINQLNLGKKSYQQYKSPLSKNAKLSSTSSFLHPQKITITLKNNQKLNIGTNNSANHYFSQRQ